MSHYNYKISGGFQKPPPEQMVGDELPDQIRYHVHLSLLGKTSMDDAERELLGPTLSNYDYVHPLPNKVMLYDISQLSDPTDGRDLIFRRDLSDFIGFDHPLDGPPPQYTSRPGTEGWVPMDICEDKYIDLRGELMENAVNASTWIKEYFLDHPDVFVSSREHFKEILDSWLVDPCDKTRTKEIVDTSTSASIIKEAPIEASTIAVVANTSSVQIETDAIQHWGEDRPPLSSLIKNGKIIADVQPLLDFAIIGNPKTATSTLMRWISKSDEVQMYNREIRSLKNNNPAEMVEVLYSLPAGSQYIRGFKDPRTSCIDYGLKHLATYWPKTKLIIGIRHPVKWFEVR